MLSDVNYYYAESKRGAGQMADTKLVNFRLTLEEYEGLKILAELTDTTQADIVRDLIRQEMARQHEAIEAYNESMAEVKRKVKK